MAARITIRHKPIGQPFVNNVHTSISGHQLLHFIRYDLIGYLWLILVILGLVTIFLRHHHTTEENVISITWFIWAGGIAEFGFSAIGGVVGMGFGISPDTTEQLINPIAILIAIPTIAMLLRGLMSYFYHPVQRIPQQI